MTRFGLPGLSLRFPTIWLAPCLLLWSFVPALITGHHGLPTSQYLFWTSLVSAVGLTACACATGRWRALVAYSTTDVRRLAALGAVGAFTYGTLLDSAHTAGDRLGSLAGSIVIGHATWPVLAVLWSVLLLGERVGGRLKGGLLLMCAAVVFIGAAGGAAPALTAVAAAAVFAFYSTLLQRIDYEPVSSVAVTFAAATAMSFIAALWLHGGIGIPQGGSWRAIVVHGLLVNGAAYVCWYRALRVAPITALAPWAALSLLVPAALGPMSGGFGAVQWASAGAIVLATVIATVPLRGHADRRSVAGSSPLAEESV